MSRPNIPQKDISGAPTSLTLLLAQEKIVIFSKKHFLRDLQKVWCQYFSIFRNTDGHKNHIDAKNHFTNCGHNFLLQNLLGW